MNLPSPRLPAGPYPADPWPDEPPSGSATSPWRQVFDEINQAVDGRRDAVATIGSINWLRHAMELAGANSNVVRNIIYRDKGRLHDKRALFLILQDLRRELGLAPIEDPALVYLGTPYAAAELEVMQVLGREQRRVYRLMVGGVRDGRFPRLLVVGKPGSGKTMLADYIQRALQHDTRPAPKVVRFDFSEPDLSSALVRFGAELGLDAGLVETRLVRIGTASAFAVQADAQADVVRVLLEHLRHDPEPRALLLHLSHGLNRPGQLGAAPLRLNTPEVPRVTAAEWLWSTLIRQLATLPDTALYLSASAAPGAGVAAAAAAGWLDGPLKLAAPTAAEARQFVKAHTPELDDDAHDDIVARAGRSYEALRTLSLLALVRRPTEHDGDDDAALERLSALVDPGGEAGLRSFLTAVAALSSPELPSFEAGEVTALMGAGKHRLGSVELAFLDPVPGKRGRYRPFSRGFVRRLAQRLADGDPERLRRAHAEVARRSREPARLAPDSEAAQRYLHHSLEARDWEGLVDWLASHPVSYASLEKVWAVARAELVEGELFEDLALEFARQLVRLGADDHVEAVRAFERLAASQRPEMRAWTAVLRAQAEVAAGRFERAEVLLDVSPDAGDAVLAAERRLTRAGVLRWRGELSAAAELVAQAAGTLRPGNWAEDQAAAALAAKTAVWAGLIAKDRGDLEAAIESLWTAHFDDGLVESRLSFQRGDVALRLGLLDAAGEELDNAVRAAERSGALPQERARFLARRGTLARLRGDLDASSEDFGAARRLLAASDADPLDAAFALAKVDDEASYIALARGDFETAIVAGTTAIATFRDYQRRRDVDATFRITRASLRLAVAYAFRGLATPYRRPLSATLPLAQVDGQRAGAGPDLEHAAASFAELMDALGRPGSGLATGSSAVRGLLRETRLAASYIASDAARALELADAAQHAARFDYLRAEAHGARAHALTRLGRHDDALAALDAAGESFKRATELLARVVGGAATPTREAGDLGLVAQLAVYRAAALLAAGDQLGAAETVCVALEDERLRPFHEGLLRAFGEAAESLAARRPAVRAAGRAATTGAPSGTGGASAAAAGPAHTAGGAASHHGSEHAWRRHRRLRSLLGMNGTGPSTPARLPDALVAAWRSRRDDRALADAQ